MMFTSFSFQLKFTFHSTIRNTWYIHIHIHEKYMLFQIHQNSWLKWGNSSFHKRYSEKIHTHKKNVDNIFFNIWIAMRANVLSNNAHWLLHKSYIIFIINWLLLAEHSKTKYPCEPIVYRSVMRLDFTHLYVIFTQNNFRGSYKQYRPYIYLCWLNNVFTWKMSPQPITSNQKSFVFNDDVWIMSVLKWKQEKKRQKSFRLVQ